MSLKGKVVRGQLHTVLWFQSLRQFCRPSPCQSCRDTRTQINPDPKHFPQKRKPWITTWTTVIDGEPTWKPPATQTGSHTLFLPPMQFTPCEQAMTCSADGTLCNVIGGLAGGMSRWSSLRNLRNLPCKSGQGFSVSDGPAPTCTLCVELCYFSDCVCCCSLFFSPAIFLFFFLSFVF